MSDRSDYPPRATSKWPQHALVGDGSPSRPTPERRRIALQLSLTFAYFDSPDVAGQIIAHCMELDVCSEGASRQEAAQDLRTAIEEYFDYKLESNELDSLLRPAPDGIIPSSAQRETWPIVVALKLFRENAESVDVLFPAQPGERALSRITIFS
jgi:predicted RNase H-like HicB family nuclease